MKMRVALITQPPEYARDGNGKLARPLIRTRRGAARARWGVMWPTGNEVVLVRRTRKDAVRAARRIERAAIWIAREARAGLDANVIGG